MMFRAILLSLVSVSAFATNPPKDDDHAPIATSQSDSRSAAIAGSKASASAVAGANATQTANGGAGGSSNQTQTAAGGNQSQTNAGNSLAVTHEDRLQAPSISAPAVYASGPCAYGGSLGLAGPGFGVSGGRSKPDTNCDRRELARIMAPLNPSAAMKILCQDPIAKAALTEAECVYVEPKAVPPSVAQAPVDLSGLATVKYVDEKTDRVFKQVTAK